MSNFTTIYTCVSLKGASNPLKVEKIFKGSVILIPGPGELEVLLLVVGYGQASIQLSLHGLICL